MNRQLKNLFAGKDNVPASVNNPNSNRPNILPRDIPSVDRAKVKAEDAEREERGEPMRFAVKNDVTVDAAAQSGDGSWEVAEDGTQVWSYRLKSPGCNSMNFEFCEYDMPVGGSLHVYDTKGKSAISRPFTSLDNNEGGELWTPVIESCDVTLEVNLPEKVSADDMKLSLCSANVGYRGFGTRPESEHGKPSTRHRELSGSCNVDVVCDADDGNDWSGEISSVAAISTGGSLFCSGSMVNNVLNDQRPLFLTAYHCGIRSNNAASLVTYWNFETSTCGGSPDGTLDQFTTGATLLAGASASDFTLVELNASPKFLEYEVTYAGWDRSGVDATTAIAIHHPSVDEKRISFEYDSTTRTSYGGSSIDTEGTHVRVIDWDSGTTEGGSSGSPLFDQNHRIIGQLHGGSAACGNNASDWYGRIYKSWNAGMSQHLDPGNSGAMFVDTLGGITLSPTASSSPTSSIVPTSSPTFAPEMADFDGILGSPKCSTVGVGCSTGDLLVKGMASSESNGPNSLDSCSDGSTGTYLTDESVESIAVVAAGGGMLQAGTQAVVTAKVHAYGNGQQDTCDFYFAENPNSVNWVLIGSVTAPNGGMQTITSPTFALPDSPFAAVRVNFRYQGSQSSCSGGNYDDVDDLVFSISQGTVEPVPTKNPTDAPSKAPSTRPTGSPSDPPNTPSPTSPPTTATPTTSPSKRPTGSPTAKPTGSPTKTPTAEPTQKPAVACISSGFLPDRSCPAGSDARCCSGTCWKNGRWAGQCKA